jgi:protein-tyrosine-phosphatase
MIRILFVCVENACRSQMAEGFAKALGEGRIAAFSAGSRPSHQVNSRAVAVMREKGIDISGHRPKGLDDLPSVRWDYIVTMGCGDACPAVPALTRLDWDLPDPKHMDDDGFRAVRDRIERQVRDLIADAIEPGARDVGR